MPKRVIPIAAASAANGELPKRIEALQERDGTGLKGVNYKEVVERYKAKVTNRASAIRAHCIECSGGQVSEVRLCTVTKCALYPFRNGEDPHRKKRTDGFAKKNSTTEGEEE